jgi:epoxyqueuosine reductase
MDGAQSMLCVGLIYNTNKPYSKDLAGQPWISRYAWGDDYHGLMDSLLQNLEGQLKDILSPGLTTRRYCDTGPVSEKTWAAAAGLGWLGKHTNLINQEKGSWFFLGEILLSEPLAPDTPSADHCGTCTRCLDVCPTQAFPQPYVLDAQKCISYLTIEKKDDFSPQQSRDLGANLYGCDLCQDVCPWNQDAALTTLAAFEARPHNWNPDLNILQNQAQQDFSQIHRGSAIKRAKLAGLKRNAQAVSKNLVSK